MIEEKVISMALRNLAAAGCKYYVVDKEGAAHLHGIEESMLRKRRERKPSSIDRSCYAHLEKVKAMTTGDVLQFTPIPNDTPEALRSVIAAAGHRFFGAKNFATTITDGVVEIIRLA